MKKILFVCTGNTCRSPMAQGMFDKIAKENGMEDIASHSAGIYGMPGDSASKNSILALKEYFDIDITSHKAKRIREEDINESSLVLTMTASHKAHILSVFPQFKNKVFTLKEYIADSTSNKYDFDVEDPYGGNLECYLSCAKEIKLCIDKLTQKLREAR